ncbi:hypothetical protein Hanom_Chr05g00429801 [Helianthus anomalus]
MFYKSMLDEYVVHISQMHPLGVVKLRHFKYACLSLGCLPKSLVFYALYTLVWKSPFFTFDRRSTDEACLRYVPLSSRDKDWKNKFFFIDVDVIPGEIHWRVMAAKEKIYPTFRTANGASFTLANFLYLEKYVYILAVDRLLHFGEESILRAYVGYFLISHSHMEGVLQGFPTSGGVEESGAAVTAPKKIIRIRRGGRERSTKGQSSRDASLATSTTTSEVVEVLAANVGITSVVAPVGPPLKKIKTYVLLMANFEAKRRVVLAGIGKYLHLF